MNDLDQLIEEAKGKIEPNIWQAISSVPWKERVAEIAKSNTLDDDQTKALLEETAFVIFGLEDPENFIFNLQDEAGIPEDKSVKIGIDINKQIMEAIDLSLKKTETSKIDSSEVSPISDFSKNENLIPPLSKTPPVIKEASAASFPPEEKTPPLAPIPNYSNYEKGNDPYREPIE